MSYGLKLWDADGTTVILDTDHRITRVLGSASTGTAGGAATFPFTAAGGTPWWSLIVASAASDTQRPTVSVAGDTLTWAYNGVGSPTNCTIIAGVY